MPAFSTTTHRDFNHRLLSVSARYPAGDSGNEEGIVYIGEKPLAQIVPEAEAIMCDQEAERLFQKPVRRSLVRVAQSRLERCTDAHVKRDPEAQFLAEVDQVYLQMAMGRTTRFRKRNAKGESFPIDPPRKLAEMMLASVHTSPEKTNWPLLKKISSTPQLLPNAEIVMDSGYHAGAQVWIDHRGIEFVDPAMNHPKLSAAKCKALIEENIYPFICKYEFAPESDGQRWHETGAFAVALSAMMCIDDRLNLASVPMHCISAPSQACGKTRLVEAIAVSMTGTRPTIVTYDGAEEFAKHAPVLLGKGDPAICMDNVAMPLNNAKLAAMLTQEYAFSNRILGKSEDVTLENVSVFFATGVNVQLSGDMPSRCVLSRIEPAAERPDQRKYSFHQVERARELFPLAVMAIKSVIRAHQLNNYPGTKLLKTASRFPDWDRRVRGAIVWAGYADPIITQDAIRDDDPLRENHLRLLWILRERFKDGPFLTCDLTSKLVPEALSNVRQITGHREGDAFNERKVGKYFTHHLKDRPYDGLRLIKTGKNQGGKVEWRVEAKLDAASFGIETEEPL